MGVKSKKKAKTRLDAYYRLAKDQGYRARSAFKLIQLNRKYDFLAKSRSIVDLCAAPGGWCQVAAKYMPVGSKIVGIDLVPIAPIRGVKTFVGDITEDKSRKVILTYLKKELVDCVIHDGAPNVGGVWAKDLFAQNALVLASLKMAVSLLKVGGWFVSKVFRSPDYQKIIWVLKQFFDKVEGTKPLSSRMESAEIFVVCAGYKAPKHVDPKLFSAQHVFAEVAPEKVMTPAGTLVTPKTNVPQGYEEFATVISRVATMSDFMACDDAKAFLKEHHEIRFPEDDRHFLKSKWSKKELVYLCHDLQQVGEADRRRLARWREQLKREYKKKHSEEDEVVSDAEKDSDDSDVEVDMNDEGAMAEELLRLRKKREKELKKKQKRVVDRKLKQVSGLINFDPTSGAEHPTDAAGFEGEGLGLGVEALANDHEMTGSDWAMASLKQVDEGTVANLMDKHWEEPDENLNMALNAVTDVNIDREDEIDMGRDPDEKQKDMTLHVEEGFEDDYDVDNHGNYVLANRSTRNAVYDDPNASEDGLPEEDEDDEDAAANAQRQRDEERYDEAGKQAKWMRRHSNVETVLNRTFPKPRDAKRKKNTEEDLVEMGGATSSAIKTLGGGGSTLSRAVDDLDDDSDSDMSSLGTDYGSDDDDGPVVNKGREDSRRKKAIVPDMGKLTAAELTKQQRKQVMKENREKRKAAKKAVTKSKKEKKEGTDTTFEEIPVAMTDPEVRARTLAMATAMLDKGKRGSIQEAGINRFMNNDDDDLPDWFLKDEERNCKVSLPITAAEIEAQRARFREMNARPGKKVMEAMGRKRKRAQRMLRGLVEKGKTDPRARDKSAGLTVRKLMRSRNIKGQDNKKKNQRTDSKVKGERKRERQKMRKDSKKGGKRR